MLYNNLMQKIILLGIVLLGIGFVFTYSFDTETEAHLLDVPQKEETTQYITPTPEKKAEPVRSVSESVFVPYWQVSNLNGVEAYDTAIYFGVSVTEDGVNRSDQGFTRMNSFISNTSNKKKLLTVRMLNTDTNLKILENTDAQQTVIEDVMQVAKEHNFDGIVLDLELSVIPFSNVKDSINLFVKNFYTEAKRENLEMQVALYGDTYYRSRPYDVNTIATYTDGILIMAYDFHKSRGEPGPNFPFAGQKTYGYDFQQMIHDFSVDVPVEKLTVIFGMYGYNWKLGKEGMPLTGAKSFSLSDAEADFASTCIFENCKVIRDTESQEMKVSYTDEEGYKHAAWFEDETSVNTKIEYMKEQGIGQVSYWTWGYW